MQKTMDTQKPRDTNIKKIIVTRFDGYRHPPAYDEVTLPQAISLVQERQRLYAILKSTLTQRNSVKDMLFAHVPDKHVSADRLSFFVSAMAFCTDARWKSLEAILLYWRIVLSFHFNVFDPVMFGATVVPRPVRALVPVHTKLACHVCTRPHALQSHLGDFQSGVFLVYHGIIYTFNDFCLRLVFEFLDTEFGAVDRRLATIKLAL